MDLHLSADQQALVNAFAELYADHVTPESVEASGPVGHDAKLWERLIEMGALDMALPDQAIGYGAPLLDLALVVEQHGRCLAPAPLVEAVVATRLLDRIGAPVGDRLVTLAVRPTDEGVALLVPAGAVADLAVVLVGDRLVLAPLGDRATHVENLGHQPLADVTLTGDATELASGAEASAVFAHAVDEWRVLTAALLEGASARMLEIVVDYVKVRHAFGRPVGAFQSVQHRLADRATELDGAQLLAREAAWSADEAPQRFASLAAMALAFCAETAVATTDDALHFHGGYGFMVEYPAQQYYRRARTWGAVLESPAEGYRRVAAEHLAAGGTSEGATR